MTVFRNPSERYEHIGSLGSGGMSTVYKARDKVLDRVVAVKQLMGELHTEEMVLRFEREAKAYAALQHPNIVGVFDFGRDENGKPFLVMDFVEGMALDDVITGGAQQLDFTLEVFTQLLDALSHAHQRSIVHRDLKPANVIIQGVGTKEIVVKLMDFGIAKFKNEEGEGAFLTQPGSVIGSPLYMSPEQASGSDAVDVRADIYSVGCMLFESLVGRPPFKGSNAMKTIFAHRSEPLSEMKELERFGELKTSLEAILRKSLEKQAGNRYQTAVEMRSELLKVHDSLKLLELEDEKKEQHAKKVARSKRIALYAVIALAACAAGALVYLSDSMIEKLADSSFQLNEEGKHQQPPQVYLTHEQQDYWVGKENDKHFLPRVPSPLVAIKGPVNVYTLSIGWDLPLVKKHAEKPTVRQKELLKGIDCLPNLGELVLNNFALSAQEIEMLARVKKLKRLTVRDCRLPPGSVRTLSTLPNLAMLSLKTSELDDLVGLSGLRASLRELLIDGIDLTKPDALDEVSKLTDLEVLRLESTGVSDSQLPSLLTLTRLKRLSLGNCPIKDNGCRTLSKLSNLTELNMNVTPITDAGLKWLSKLTKLEKLEIQRTRVTDAGIAQLTKIQALRQLKVFGCSNVSAAEISRLKSEYPNLQISDPGTPVEIQFQLKE